MEHRFGRNLKYGKLLELATEFQSMRLSPPDVTIKKGSRAGEILAFIRGLRLSARVIYVLRDLLSGRGLEVSWGHLLDNKGACCSPECDIIIHDEGYVQRWNGGADSPVMDFRFIEARKARVVLSCKSTLTDLDRRYPPCLKQFGIKKVFLFAERCDEESFSSLRRRAKEAGYLGLGCLYFTSKRGASTKTDETLNASFFDSLIKATRR